MSAGTQEGHQTCPNPFPPPSYRGVMFLETSKESCHGFSVPPGGDFEVFPAVFGNKPLRFFLEMSTAGYSVAGKGPTGKVPRHEFRALTIAGQRHETEPAERDLQRGNTGGGRGRTALQSGGAPRFQLLGAGSTN